MNQSTMGEGINCGIMREKEGECSSAPTWVIPVFLNQLKQFSVLICDCWTFLIFCAQNQWRTRVTASQTLLVPPPCTDTWTAIISRWTHQDNGTLGYIVWILVRGFTPTAADVLYFAALSIILSPRASSTHRHTHARTDVHLHIQPHSCMDNRPGFDFDLLTFWVDWKVGSFESHVSALTRELSLPVGRCTVTGLSLALHWLTVADKHDLTGKHNVNTHRCQCTSKGHFVDETLNSSLWYF